MQILNIQELEKLLIANWTAFLNHREIFKILTDQTKNNTINGPINGLTVSRFELKPKGFLIWMEFNSNQVAYTTELILNFDGELIPIRTELT